MSKEILSSLWKLLTLPADKLLAVTVCLGTMAMNPLEWPDWLKIIGQVLVIPCGVLLLTQWSVRLRLWWMARRKAGVKVQWVRLTKEQQNVLRNIHAGRKRHGRVASYTTEKRWYEELVEWGYLDSRFHHGKYHGMPPTDGVEALITVEGWKAVEKGLMRETGQTQIGQLRSRLRAFLCITSNKASS